MTCGILSEGEKEIIVEQLIKGNIAQGKDGVSFDSADKALYWAKQTKVDQALLELVLDQKILITINEGDISFLADYENSAKPY